MSKWLVIGNTSFTGEHFIDYLKSLGEAVTGVSLRNDAALLALQSPWDYVVNFAAANVVSPSWEHAEDYTLVNLLQHIPLWEQMRLMPLTKYVHISTPEVYGNTKFQVTEEQAFNPSTPYAASRAAAETYLKVYHKGYGLPVVFTRAANVYGPGQQFYRVIPKLIAHIKKGIKFPLEGGGMSIRSFVNVLDVCRATHLVATQGISGEAYHIATRSSQSIREIVQRVVNLMDTSWAAAVDTTAARPGQDAIYSLDTRKIEELGWAPVIDLRDGLIEVIRWINKDWENLKDEPMEFEFIP